MSMMANPYREYQKQDVLMSSPVDLIVMLYSGCIKNLKIAKGALENKELEESNRYLQKAQDIISELTASLDFNYEISDDLARLYDFMLNEIIRINIKKDAATIEPLIDMLSKLRDSWVKVQRELRTKGTVSDGTSFE